MFPKPHISQDSFFHETTPSPAPAATTHPPQPPITIYFICGNPGLISYYHSFLSLLSDRLCAASRRKFHVVGHSLAGFELASGPGPGGPARKKHEHEHEHGKAKAKAKEQYAYYYDLEEQIRFVREKLAVHMAGLRREYSASASASASLSSVPGTVDQMPQVILMGHSVGSYIAMEVLRRYREDSDTTTTTAAAAAASGIQKTGFDIIGGVMLFPTVLDIAKSPSGRKLTFLLRLIPQLAIVVAFVARVLTLVFPDCALRTLIRWFMKSPPEEAVTATASFLKSKYGVREALHMAADEMRTITSDKWSDDVWGVSTVKEPMTRLFFYFGRNDHWVAERTKEEILELRGRTQTGPKMVVCEDSLPHAFCLRHSDIMSRKVADMITAIVAE
ncbi:hypothetical protein ARAM_006343 [Aspergillus rambellii]|uniref:AB hydrolase-1 domain-containing protein n=1 Tax=Aspergillus rambellii TaxID=308745 RepID=A0A0F8V0Y7_9EURO|nr:hypothetical protein ARAM_006343 [Aspergillus rambellii]